ncbi:PAS domain S-box protein, partial [Thalassolituus oleivorans]
MSFLKNLFSAENNNGTQEAMRELEAKVDALNKSQAMIEFDMNGNILTANDNFLNVMGYRLDEVQGKHHSIFVGADYKASNEYRQFWDKLNRGEFDSNEYLR